MDFEWNRHRFSGGTLAFDIANTVVLRHDPLRRVDRFAEPANFRRFSQAAEILCAEGRIINRDAKKADLVPPLLIELRECIDRHFRAMADGTDNNQTLADLLFKVADILGSTDSSSLALATAHSALRICAAPERDRIRVCAACGWLFLDRSKNRSRRWCDMSVCGNRAKAKRHYSSAKSPTSGTEQVQ
jgi:predicted RNA-binding Zn ribbon-like protein